MNIVPDITKSNSVSSIETEQVQQEKQEYYLLGTFLRTKGLNLFLYDSQKNEVREAKIIYSDTIHVYKLPDKFIYIDWEYQKCTIEGNFIYFECLNLKNANERVKKWKEGKIKELANLKKPNTEGIKFY